MVRGDRYGIEGAEQEIPTLGAALSALLKCEIEATEARRDTHAVRELEVELSRLHARHVDLVGEARSEWTLSPVQTRHSLVFRCFVRRSTYRQPLKREDERGSSV